MTGTTEVKDGHLEMATEIQQALRKWCKYRLLANNTPSKEVIKEINEATDIIVNHLLNPVCNCEEHKMELLK